MKKQIQETEIMLLKDGSSVVPRDRDGNIRTDFKVGKEYEVYGLDKNETIKVRCTQSHPTSIRPIQ
jgi:hypothetical protein